MFEGFRESRAQRRYQENLRLGLPFDFQGGMYVRGSEFVPGPDYSELSPEEFAEFESQLQIPPPPGSVAD